MHHPSLLFYLLRSQTVLHAEDIHVVSHQYIQNQLIISVSLMPFGNYSRELFKANIVLKIDIK